MSDDGLIIKSWPWLIAAGVIIVVLGFALAWLVGRLLRSNRADVRIVLPLVQEQKVGLPAAGEMVLRIEMPRFDTDYRRLQFEIVAHRLASEYAVDALYEPVDIFTARWLRFPDEATRRKFERDEAASLAKDVEGNPVFLAANKYNLKLTLERWPSVVGLLALLLNGCAAGNQATCTVTWVARGTPPAQNRCPQGAVASS